MKIIALIIAITVSNTIVCAQTLGIVKRNGRDTIRLRNDHIIGFEANSTYYEGSVSSVNDSTLIVNTACFKNGISSDTQVTVILHEIKALYYCPHESTESCLNGGPKWKPYVQFLVCSALLIGSFAVLPSVPGSSVLPFFGWLGIELLVQQYAYIDLYRFGKKWQLVVLSKS